MRQNNSNDKNAMLAKIATINQVEGFDPKQNMTVSMSVCWMRRQEHLQICRH